MNGYIIESMARMGCGITDTQQVHETVAKLPKMAQDVLDAWYNFGRSTDLLPAAQADAEKLRAEYSDDDLDCMQSYVNAYRNTEKTYVTL